MTKQVKSAFTRFFREKKMVFLNSNQRRVRFSHSDSTTLSVNFENNAIKLPQIGEIKVVLQKHLKEN